MSSRTNSFRVRWEHHSSNMMSGVATLLSNDSFADVTLIASDGSPVAAHKIILASCSPYFQTVLEKNPCQHPTIILKDINIFDLKSLIAFIYHGEICVSQESINSIVETAIALKVRGLAEASPDELRKMGGMMTQSELSIPEAIENQQAFETQSNDESEDYRTIPAGAGKNPSTSAEDGLSKESLNSATAEHSSGSGRSHSLSLSSSSSSFSSSIAETPRKRWKKSLDKESASSSAESIMGLNEKLNTDPNRVCQEAINLPPSTLKTDPIRPSKPHTVSTMRVVDAHSSHSLQIPGFGSKTQGNAILTRTTSDPSSGHHLSTPSNALINRKCSSLDNDQENSPDTSMEEIDLSSSNLSAKGRRGRLLLKQHRFKKPEIECDKDSEIPECSSSSSHTTSINTIQEETEASSSKASTYSASHVDETPITLERIKNLPEVRVSMSSPTPPQSPLEVEIEEKANNINNERDEEGSNILTSNVGALAMSNASLLSVPSHSLGEDTSNQNATFIQTVTASHPLIPISTVSIAEPSEPVIRRQSSQPNPVHQSSLLDGSSFIATTTGGTFRSQEGTVYRLVPHELVRRGNSEETYIFETNERSLIQIMPSHQVQSASSTPVVVTRTKSFSGEDSFANSSQQSGCSFKGKEKLNSKDVKVKTTLSLEDEPSAVSTSSDQPIQRLGHCPAIRPGPPLGCNFCWNSVDSCGRILRRKTKYHCPECHINLCIVPCFQEYHEKKSRRKIRSKLTKPRSM